MTRAEEIARKVLRGVPGAGIEITVLPRLTAALESFAREEREHAFDGLTPHTCDKAVADERERCAKIADTWARSHSCSPDGPCDHIRTGAAIAARIREGGEVKHG